MKKRTADGELKLVSRGVDRLSGLPDDVIGHILGFLPTPQAVLTSRLSRRWRRVWAHHVRALDLSVRNCTRRGVGPSFSSLSREALARFPMPGIPSLSIEFDHHRYLAKANTWYVEAMERAVGSVRVTVPCGVYRLEFPLCTRAESLALRLHPLVDLELRPADPAVRFGRLTELSLSTVRLFAAAGTPPFDEFLSSCCPRLRRLRLSCVGGAALRRLVLRSDALEALHLNNVDDLACVDVAAANLRSLAVCSCFRFPTSSAVDDTEAAVVVSAPRLESMCWYRSYPKRLTFPAGLASVRRLSGLKLPTLGRSDRHDFPYTLQLLRECSSLVEHLELEFVLPDEMALLNWLGQEQGSCEDLMSYVPPQLPRVSVLSLKVRWGCGGSIGPSLASLLSRVPAVTRLHVDSSPYCLTVLESAVPPRRGYQWGDRIVRTDEEKLSQLGSLREISVRGLKGTDGEECRLIEVLLGAAAPPPSLESISLAFCDGTVVSVADEIATELRERFPMATGRWTKTACSRMLEWTKNEK